MPHGPQQTIYGEGSGFIVAADGVVLTNAHVVADAKEVIVKLTDHREFTAKVIGLDEASDVAVLKIAAKGLPTVRVGDSSKVAVGEWVLAIGAPFANASRKRFGGPARDQRIACNANPNDAGAKPGGERAAAIERRCVVIGGQGKGVKAR